MHSLKQKLLKYFMTVVVLLGSVIFTELTVQLLEGGVRTVQASTVVYGEDASTYSANINDPEVPLVAGVNYQYTFYLSKDGKTRYAQETEFSHEVWYKWVADEKKKYGGEWIEVKEKIVPQKSKDMEALKKVFEAEYGYPYTIVANELKEQLNNKKADSNSGTTPDSDNDGKTIQGDTQYYKYISLGQKPTPASIISSAILRGGGQSGIDEKSLSFSELAKFPAPESFSTSVEGISGEVTVYEYGNLKQVSNSSTKEGATTVNMVKVLTYYGWLTTNNKGEKDTPWYQDLMNNISNPIYAVGTIIATIFGVIFDFLADLFLSLIKGAATVVGWMLPARLTGFAMEAIQGIPNDQNWFTDVAKEIIDKLFGTGDKATFDLLFGLSLAFAVLWSIAEFAIRATKGRMREGLISFKKFFFKLGMWSLGLVVFVNLGKIVGGSFTMQAEQAKKLQSETSFNSKKFFIATNGDVSVLYPDKFNLVQKNNILSADELKQFKPNGETVRKANEAVENILGSELSAEIDGKDDGSSGVLTGVVNNSTWTVNDYFAGIERSGKASTENGFSLNTNIAANRLPSGLSWNPSISNSVRVAVTPTGVQGADNIQDIIKQGHFMFKGTPVWFDNQASSFKGPDDSFNYVSSGGWVGIKYSPKVYTPTLVSITDSHTYLYGAKNSNNEMTLNVSNYTFFQGLTLNSDLLSFPEPSSQVEEGEAIKRTNKDVNGTTFKKIDDTLEDLSGDGKITSDNLQWRNAYMIAMYNKYAGTDDSFGQQGHMGFSNQSTAILLQSVYQNDSMHYHGYNTPNSKADNSKAQTKDNVYITTYASVGSGQGLANSLSRTSYGLIANGIVMFGITLCVFQFGIGLIIKDSWVYFGRWLLRGSATGLAMSIVVVAYYWILFNIAQLISSLILNFIGLVVTKLSNEGVLANVNTFVIGVVLIGLALLTTLRLISFNGRKVSFSSLFFTALTIGYDALKGWSERLDEAMYGSREQKTTSDANRLDEAVGRRLQRGANRGGGLFRSALGSFIGNRGADLLEERGNTESPDDKDPGSKKGGFGLPPIGGLPIGRPISKSGFSPTSGGANNLVRMGLSGGKKKLLQTAAIGALGFTPFGTAATAYMAGRGAVKGMQLARNLGKNIQHSQFGRRMGLNGRVDQLKARYGLGSNDELAAEIRAGHIKPTRKGDEERFSRFVDNQEKIALMEKQGTITPEARRLMESHNGLSGSGITMSSLTEKVAHEEEKEQRIQEIAKNPSMKIDPINKGIVIGKEFAKGNLMNHFKRTIPERREIYAREQLKNY